MPLRVDSRDVLDPNGRTRRAFSARIVGRYRPTGPNRWDDYELLPVAGEPMRVAAGVKVQVEPEGARCRVRRRGEVVLVEWIPCADDLQLTAQSKEDTRRAFLEACIEDYASPPGFGLAAVVAKKLKDPED